MRFAKTARLTLSAEFRRVRGEGTPSFGRFMILNVLRVADGESGPRIGIVTSRRIGNAVQRNRTRRRFREIVRMSLPDLASNAWLVIVTKRAAVEAPLEEIKAEWLRLARRQSLLRQ